MRFLLATHHLSNWAGSELVTIEIAEEIARRGHNVDIFTSTYSEEFCSQWIKPPISQITKTANIKSFNSYDFIYAHHGMISRLLVDQNLNQIFGETRPAFVYNHLSPAESFERPGSVSEILLADLILANSSETHAELQRLGSRFASAAVMPNPAPKHFETAQRKRYAGKLNRLLVVSNHLPAEVMEALNILKEQDVEIFRIGLPEFSKRVEPDDIKKVDAVLTIGKTVQYSIRAKCPVYLYDHFSGPGWLTLSNAKIAEEFNFSGRGFSKAKSGSEISKEICHIPDDALNVYAICPNRFKAEYWVDRFIEIASIPRKPLIIPKEVDNIIDLIFKLEANTFSLVDRLYNSSEDYRIAYQSCCSHYETISSDFNNLKIEIDSLKSIDSN